MAERGNQDACSVSLWRKPTFTVSTSRVKFVRDVPCSSAITHGRFRQLHAADNSVNPFARDHGADERTEFRVGIESAEFLRELKRNLKTRAVLGKAAPDRGLRDVKNDARKHRHIEAALLLIEKPPFHRSFRSAEPADHSMIAALQKTRRGLQGELDVLADSRSSDRSPANRSTTR